MNSRRLLIAVVVIALGWALYLLFRPATRGGGVTLAPAPASAASGATVPGSGGANEAAGTSVASAASAPASALAPGASPANGPAKAHPTVALSRPLTPPTQIQMGGRLWTVLGSRLPSSENGNQTVLVLRDEVSGQLEYRQPALRLMFNEGVNAEAFIRGLSDAKRLFVNPIYADIGVDPERIGDLYTALTRDPRVAKVEFIPLARRQTLR